MKTQIIFLFHVTLLLNLKQPICSLFSVSKVDEFLVYSDKSQFSVWLLQLL